MYPQLFRRQLAAAVAGAARRRRQRSGMVLDRAIAYWKADQYDESGVLKDLSGNGHNAQLGSAAGADSNDPLFLPYDSTKYLYLPGSNGNYASTPDAAVLDITGDIDIRARVALDDWTPAATQTLVSKRGAAGQRSWQLDVVATSGVLRLGWTEDGTTFILESSTAAPTVSDGARLWIRATLDVDDGGGNYVVKFYTGGAGETPAWVQLGATVTIAAGPTSIFSSTSPVECGSSVGGTTQLMAGALYRAQIYDGIGGTLVFDADFSTAEEPYATFTESSANAATVTINRSSGGKKASLVDRDLFLLGTDDYFEVSDHADLDFALGEGLAVVWFGRLYGTTANQALIAKKADLTTAAGYSLDRGTANALRFMCADGTNTGDDVAGAITQGAATVVVGVRDVIADDLEVFASGSGSGSPTTDPTAATLANAGALRIGRLAGAGSAYGDFEFMGAALFREAPDDQAIVDLSTEFGV